MHLGLMMECDYRETGTQQDAFNEAFRVVEEAEEHGLDGVWLAERHFAPPNRTTDPSGAAIPSIVSVPLILASAIAARTQRLRIGIAVAVLPLYHPIRLAEEAAMVDQISTGRLDFGIGRSSLALSYEGYGVPYSESRERFQESLDVILKAWTLDPFSYHGNYFTFNDVYVVPKPYQQPYPPLRIAATSEDTFPQAGKRGVPIFVGLLGFDVVEVAQHLNAYREAWRAAGHPGNGDVLLRIPAYVAETADQATSEPEASTMILYRRVADAFASSASEPGVTDAKERAQLAQRLYDVSYQELLQDRLAFGTPEVVAGRLKHLAEDLGLSGFVIEPNVGGGIPADRMFNSIQLLAQEVAPLLR